MVRLFSRRDRLFNLVVPRVSAQACRRYFSTCNLPARHRLPVPAHGKVVLLQHSRRRVHLLRAVQP